MERIATARPTDAAPTLEEQLASRVRQQAALAELGLRALAGLSADDLMREAVALVADVLDVEYVLLLERVAGGNSMVVRAGRGWLPDTIGSAEPASPGTAVRYIMESIEPVVVDDFQIEARFPRPPILARHQVRSMLGVVVLGPAEPFGILGAHSQRPFAFSPEDAMFVQSVANLVGQAIRRADAEEETRVALVRQRDAVARLQSLDELKNTFLEAVSHELRTPLASVLGFALTLEARHEQMSTDEIDAVLDRLAVNARKLDRLLRDLLDLDRLYRRIIVARRRPADLATIVRTAIGECDLGERTVHIDENHVVVNVDAAKIERIVENLLNNVVRHTPADASIWIRIDERPDGALLTVEDDGPGVPDALKGAIFDAFQRGSSPQAHAPGTGIGLALVARFAELHGGRAWVEDRPGGGARFRVYLPSEGDPVPALRLAGQV